MKKILIVDDSAFMRNILKDLLLNKETEPVIKHNIELYEADGKVEATKQLNKVKPDVILLDIVMRESETEGVQFVEEIHETFPVDKIIMVSSTGQSSIINRCKELGIKKYIQKPFDRDQVIEAVNKVLG